MAKHHAPVKWLNWQKPCSLKQDTKAQQRMSIVLSLPLQWALCLKREEETAKHVTANSSSKGSHPKII